MKLTFASDVWSIGVMLYYAIYMVVSKSGNGKFPFEYENSLDAKNEDVAKLFEVIKHHKLDFTPEKVWSEVNSDITDLISDMLKKKAKSRIVIEDVLNHDAFKPYRKLEKEAKLSKREKKKLVKYFELTPLERKFLRFATKSVHIEEHFEHKEKFMLLDRSNAGEIVSSLSLSSKRSSSPTKEGNKSSNCSTQSEEEGRKISYSDFMAAMIDKEITCGPDNAEIAFHFLNPTYLTDDMFKKEFRKAIVCKNDDTQVVEGIDEIQTKER
jgi:serine/threonine protein kinase